MPGLFNDEIKLTHLVEKFRNLFNTLIEFKQNLTLKEGNLQETTLHKQNSASKSQLYEMKSVKLKIKIEKSQKFCNSSSKNPKFLEKRENNIAKNRKIQISNR